MKTKLAVKGVKDGVDIRTGVWRDSESGALITEASVITGLGGIVIFGLGLASLFADGGVDEVPGCSGPSGSILIPRSIGSGGWESESELESWILQMGRWASRTSSSFSFFFCSSVISF